MQLENERSLLGLLLIGNSIVYAKDLEECQVVQKCSINVCSCPNFPCCDGNENIGLPHRLNKNALYEKGL